MHSLSLPHLNNEFSDAFPNNFPLPLQKNSFSLSLSLLAINSTPCLEREVFVAQKEIRIRRTASLLKEKLAFTLSLNSGPLAVFYTYKNSFDSWSTDFLSLSSVSERAEKFPAN
jgi:hypothetical protein